MLCCYTGPAHHDGYAAADVGDGFHRALLEVQPGADPGSRCNINAALKEGLDALAQTPSGSAATAMYFALARQLKFQARGMGWCWIWHQGGHVLSGAH